MPEVGGETHFCDMYGAYERLDPAWKERIADLRAVHNLDFSRTRRHGEDPMTEEQRRARPPVDHPIVRTHPETGRKCIYLGDHAEYIVGMSYAEGRALIEELNGLAVHPDLELRTPLASRRADRVGQPLRDAPRNIVRSRDATARDTSLHGAGGSSGLTVLPPEGSECALRGSARRSPVVRVCRAELSRACERSQMRG